MEKNENIEKKENTIGNLTKNRPYFLQRLASSKPRAKIEKERIKNLTHKVDNYLKHLEDIENTYGGLKIDRDEIKQKTPIVDKERLGEIVNRLYKVTKIEKKEKEVKDVKKLDIMKAKANNKKYTEIILPTIIKKEKAKITTDLTDTVSKTIKRGNSAFHRLIKKGLIRINLDELESKKEENGREEIKKKSNDDTLSLAFSSNNLTAKDTTLYDLKNLIKESGYDFKKLKEFQKKNPSVDISNYIHKAKIKEMKTTQKKKNINQESQNLLIEAKGLLANNVKSSNLILEDNSEQEEMYTKSFLWSCKHNNYEYMKAHLITSKSI